MPDGGQLGAVPYRCAADFGLYEQREWANTSGITC